MKARVIRLDFRKDPTLDPQGLLDGDFAKPYIIETKKALVEQMEADNG